MHINIHEILVGATANGFQWSTFLTSIFGVVVGGLITLFTSIYTVQKNYENNFELLKTKEEMEIKATLKAIITELRGLRQIFEFEFIPKILTDEKYLWFSYPLGTDYFTIFNANTSKIGKINNDELRECIINLYITAKFFLDSISTNNELLEYYEKCYNDIHSFSSMSQGTPKQQENLNIALERLAQSKTNNLVPTCYKMIELFKQLEIIWQK